MSAALILFAHGARDPAWANPLQRVQAAIRAADPAARVDIAFLELMAPSLADCAAALAAEGCRRIAILPMFMARSGHLKREVPDMVDDLRRRHPQVEFVLAGAVGEDEAVIRAMAAVGLACLELGGNRPLDRG